MTLEEFRSKYRLQQRLTQRGVASYQAISSSGRVVMVHSLDSAAREEVDHVRGMVHRLEAADRNRIVEILDVDGAPVIVTEYLQGFQTLAQWLEARTRAAPTAPSVKAQGPPRGEFTQLFGPTATPQAPVLERPAADPPAAAPRAPAAAPAAGEFTQLFGAVNPAELEPPPKPPAKPPAQPPAAGEFTQMFGAIKDQPPAKPRDITEDVTLVTGPAIVPSPSDSEPPPAAPPPAKAPPPEGPKVVVRWRDKSAPEPPPPAAAPKPQIRWKEPGAEGPIRPPPAKAPGEFTRLFGAEGAPPAAEGPAAPAEPLLPEPEPPRPPSHAPRSGMGPGKGGAAGGFTQMLRAAADSLGDPTDPSDAGGGGGGPPPVHEPGAKKAPGDFTNLMSGLPPAAPSRGAPPAAPAASGPSEFTRMMSGLPAPPSAPGGGGGRQQAAPPPPAPEQEEGEEGPSLRKLFIALGAVVLLAVVIVIYFAVKG
jgi:hypothetical protein